jgi:hypothetical protein
MDDNTSLAERLLSLVQVSLKDHLLTMMKERDRRYTERFEAQEKSTVYALAAADKAATKAETAIEKRFDSVNELRAMAQDILRTTMPRTEAEIRLKALEDAQKSRSGQDVGLKMGWGWAVGAIGVAIAVLSLLR